MEPVAACDAATGTQETGPGPVGLSGPAGAQVGVEDGLGGRGGAGLGALDGAAGDAGGFGQVALGQPRGPAQRSAVRCWASSAKGRCGAPSAAERNSDAEASGVGRGAVLTSCRALGASGTRTRTSNADTYDIGLRVKRESSPGGHSRPTFLAGHSDAVKRYHASVVLRVLTRGRRTRRPLLQRVSLTQSSTQWQRNAQCCRAATTKNPTGSPE